MKRASFAQASLALLGGLAVLAAVAAPWSRTVTTRSVAGVRLAEVQATPGVDVAGLLLPAGLGACLAALLLVGFGGRVRRVVGGALLVLAAAGLAGFLPGLFTVLGRPGLTAAPLVAGAGLAAMIAAGLLGMVRGGAPLTFSARYEVGGEVDTDDEWHLAGDDEREQR